MVRRCAGALSSNSDVGLNFLLARVVVGDVLSSWLSMSIGVLSVTNTSSLAEGSTSMLTRWVVGAASSGAVGFGSELLAAVAESLVALSLISFSLVIFP